MAMSLFEFLGHSHANGNIKPVASNKGTGIVIEMSNAQRAIIQNVLAAEGILSVHIEADKFGEHGSGLRIRSESVPKMHALIGEATGVRQPELHFYGAQSQVPSSDQWITRNVVGSNAQVLQLNVNNEREWPDQRIQAMRDELRSNGISSTYKFSESTQRWVVQVEDLRAMQRAYPPSVSASPAATRSTPAQSQVPSSDQWITRVVQDSNATVLQLNVNDSREWPPERIRAVRQELDSRGIDNNYKFSQSTQRWVIQVEDPAAFQRTYPASAPARAATPEKSSPQNAAPKGVGANNVVAPDTQFPPRTYGGDTRIDRGQGYVAMADSGGEDKYSGVNHDRVAIGGSDLGRDVARAQQGMVRSAADAVRGIRGGGSTLSIATWQAGVVTTTHVGDSPIWVMEQTPAGRVIPHLINGNLHNPYPAQPNVIGQNLGSGAEADALRDMARKPGDFQNTVDFTRQLQAGSQFYILGGSDGLLDHIGAKENGPAGQRVIDQQVADAGDRYAKVFENHLKQGGSVSDPALAIQLNDAATQLKVEGYTGENLQRALGYKDNTSFVAAKMPPTQEITLVVADGNGSVGNLTAEAAVEGASRGRVNPIPMPGLEQPHSADVEYDRVARETAAARASGGRSGAGRGGASGSTAGTGEQPQSFLSRIRNWGRSPRASLDGVDAPSDATPEMKVGKATVTEIRSTGQAQPATAEYSPTAQVAANDGRAGQPMTDVADGGGRNSAAKFMPKPNSTVRPSSANNNEVAPIVNQAGAAEETPVVRTSAQIAEAAEAASRIRGIAVKGGLVGAGIGAVIRGGVAASTGSDSATVAQQAGRGVLDAAIPGLGDGFTGITGRDSNRPVNWVDQSLNVLDTATGATATGGLVAAVPTGGTSLAVTAVAGIGNIGVNLIHDGTYALGLSREGGIITGGKNIITTAANAYQSHQEFLARKADIPQPVVEQFNAGLAAAHGPTSDPALSAYIGARDLAVMEHRDGRVQSGSSQARFGNLPRSPVSAEEMNSRIDDAARTYIANGGSLELAQATLSGANVDQVRSAGLINDLINVVPTRSTKGRSYPTANPELETLKKLKQKFEDHPDQQAALNGQMATAAAAYLNTGNTVRDALTSYYHLAPFTVTSKTVAQLEQDKGYMNAADGADGSKKDGKLTTMEIAANMVKIGVYNSKADSDHSGDLSYNEAITAQRTPSEFQADKPSAGRRQ